MTLTLPSSTFYMLPPILHAYMVPSILSIPIGRFHEGRFHESFHETFRNIPKVSESFGDRSLYYIIFTYGIGSVMSF